MDVVRWRFGEYWLAELRKFGIVIAKRGQYSLFIHGRIVSTVLNKMKLSCAALCPSRSQKAARSSHYTSTALGCNKNAANNSDALHYVLRKHSVCVPVGTSE